MARGILLTVKLGMVRIHISLYCAGLQFAVSIAKHISKVKIPDMSQNSRSRSKEETWTMRRRTLISIRNEILSTVHVDVRAGTIRSRKHDGARVNTERRISTGC